jgi:hypothetical protein
VGRDLHQGLGPLGDGRRRLHGIGVHPLLKRVYSAANLPEAQILADRLAAGGIRARILNANASSIAGELPVDLATPQLWVDDARHADRARALIEEFLNTPSGPPRPCPACGEENPSAFELCWSCGKSLG